AIAGGALGLAIAAWGTKAAIRVLPSALPRAATIGLDGRVLVYTLGISLVAGILFGLAPALKVGKANLHDTLKEGGRGSSGARHRLQGVFVVVEMALALVLLVGAGLMIRSLVSLWAVNPGFNPHNALTFSLAYPPDMGNLPPDQMRNELLQLDASLAAVPGIQSISAYGGSLPMQGDSELPFWLEGHPKPQSDNDMNWALFYLTTPDYLKAMQIPLERGRFITAQDTNHSPNVIVIDEQFSKKFFPGVDPIGKLVNLSILNVQAQVVGVAGHVKHWGLDSDATAKIQAQFYFPVMQVPDQFMPLLSSGVDFVARTQGPPDSFTDPMRRAAERFNSQLVFFGPESMDDIITDSLADRRFSMILLGVFAVLALVLSCIGIYGVISYLVGQRTHEFGIRMALGAQRKDVLQMVLGQGAKLALIGVAIGLAAALALTRFMARMLFGVTTHDPLTFIGVATLLILVAVFACYIPARRATRVDPMVALRYE
ncbi:MAG: FtsX-like permease family protein, partial [Candidatus Acidiferrales bacterium]